MREEMSGVLTKNIKKEFYKNRVRVILTVLPIVFGILSILFMVSVATSVETNFSETMFNGRDFLKISANKNHEEDNNLEAINNNISLLKNIKGIKEVVVSGFIEGKEREFLYNGNRVQIIAVNDEFLDEMVGDEYNSELTYLSENFVGTLGLNNITVNSGNENLNFSIDKNNRIEKNDAISNYLLDDKGEYIMVVYIPYKKYFELLNQGIKIKMNSYEIRVDNENNLDKVIGEIELNGFQVSTDWINAKKIKNIFNIVKVAMALIGGIALVISIFSIINSINIIIKESKKDIAIMKSIGCKVKEIKVGYLIEVFKVFTIGFVAAIVINIPIVKLINVILDKYINYGNVKIEIPISLNLINLIIILLVTVVLVLIIINKVLQKQIGINVVEALKEE